MKKIILPLLLLFASLSCLGQTILMKLGVQNEATTTISNGATYSLGNYGAFSGFVGYDFIIENTDASTPLLISEVAMTNNDKRISFYSSNDSYTVVHGTPLKLYVFYAISSDYSTGKETISFKTNDTSNTNVSVQVVANPDKGKLEVSSTDFPLTNNQINVGDIVIGNSIHNKFELENVGKGYMKVKAVENIQTNNYLSCSYATDQFFGPGSAWNNNITFKALKKGIINTSFTLKTIRGEKTEHTIRIAGKVIAPVAEWKYSGVVIGSDAEINFPVNNFVSSQFSVVVHNTGDFNLNVGDIDIEDDTDSEFHVASGVSGDVVKPGEKGTFIINFVPKKIGDRRVKLVCNSDGYNTKQLSFYMNVQTQAAKLSFSDKSDNKYDRYSKFPIGTSVSGDDVFNEIVLTNTGNKELKIKTLEIEYAPENFTITNTPKLTLLPNESTSVKVKFTPSSNNNTTASAHLRIVSNNVEANTIRFRLEAQKKFARIKMKTNNNSTSNGYVYSFGATSINTPKVLECTVSNTGNIDLDVSKIEIADDVNQYYSIHSASSGKVIAPGQSGKVEVRFAPKAVKDVYFVKLKITTNDYLNGRYVINLDGWAIEPLLKFSAQIGGHAIQNNEEIEVGPFTHKGSNEVGFTVKNTGYEQLSVSNFRIESAEGVETTFDKDISGEYDNQESMNFTAKFKVKTPGEKLIHVTFNTNEKRNSAYKATIKFMAQLPVMEVTEGESTLQNNVLVNYNFDKKRTFTLKNTGNKALYINNIYLESNDENSFSVNVSEPYIRANEQFSFEVPFNAISDGLKKATLIIETDDAIQPRFSVQLSAEKSKTTSVIDPTASTIAVYPNPFAEYLTIDNKTGKEMVVNIYSMAGVLKFQQQYSGTKFSVQPNLMAGNYILEVVAGSSKQRKLILRK